MPYIREDQAYISFSVADESGAYIPFGEAWYSIEGGNLESDDSKTRAGGMGDEFSLGGPSSRDDATLTIQLSDVVITWHKTLETRVRQDAPCKASYQFKNRLKQAYGTTHTIYGTLKSAFLPDMDTGGNEAAMYSVIMSCDEVAT